MTAVKAKLKIEDFVSYLLIKESEFDIVDKDGRTFIDHLFDCENDYIIDMINHLARRVNMWELTRKRFNDKYRENAFSCFSTTHFARRLNRNCLIIEPCFQTRAWLCTGTPLVGMSS